MSKKKLLNRIVIAVLAVMVVSASVISYSIATRESSSKDIKSGLENKRAAISGGMDYITNIDRIIENSYLSTDEAYFNVVEILPATADPADTQLKDYCVGTNERFKKYVIDKNKETETRDMVSKKVRYNRIDITTLTELTDVEDILNTADLIYLSSPQYKSYYGQYNISESIYNWLSTYTMNTYRPIIMDYVTPYTPEALTFESFAYMTANNYIRYRTFFWDYANASDPDSFFKAKSIVKDGKNHNISFYLPFNVDNNTANGKILVVRENENLLADGWASYPLNDFLNNAYFGTEDKKPKKITPIYKKPSELTVDELVKGNYDFIILENDIMHQKVSEDIFNALKGLSLSSQYIIYDKKNLPSDTGDIDENTSNYLKLMSMLMNKKGMPRYTNVLPVNYNHFDVLNKDDKAAIDAAKEIADLINYSDYRGSLVDGKNGKMYRVLELQPCYPIDLKLAKTKKTRTYQMDEYPGGPFIAQSADYKGDYYEVPENVLSGVSEDEVDGNTEYYKFELSKAKIAKALGLKYSQIKLDQMSTEEFIGNKAVVLETYDLVYVGGNTSALTPAKLKTPYGATSAGIPARAYNYLPVFDMYTHTGFPVLLQASKADGNTALASEQPFGEITKNKTYVTYNGNDITTIKLKELQNYINAGMPIIFSDVVSKEFDNMSKQKRLVQMLRYHKIDPDSNMYQLFDYAKTLSKDKDLGKSILWNFDISSYDKQDEFNLNKDKMYGPSRGDYVTLFNKKSMAALTDLVAVSKKRPSLSILQKPKDYVEGYESSYNDNVDGKMTITAKAQPADGSQMAGFDMKLYIDIDGNGSFSEDELVSRAPYSYVKDNEGSVDLTYSFEDPRFFGIIHWKVVAELIGSNGECDISTGYAYYKRTGDKKEVNVLQIMPLLKNLESPQLSQDDSQIGQADGHSLYLCTECQMAKYRAKYNIQTNGDPLLNTGGNKEDLVLNHKIHMGLHEHKFGIVKYDTACQPMSGYDVKFASGKGSENWDYNFADLLADDYNFYTDIIYLNELEALTNSVKGQDDATREQAMSEYDVAKDNWELKKDELENSGIEEELKTFLLTLKGKNLVHSYASPVAPTMTIKLTDEMIDNWIKHKAYYRAYYFLGSTNAEFNKLYADWVVLHDEVVKAYNKYRDCKRLCYTSEEWLAKNYDVVVLGFAENFGGRDLNVDECTDLKSFVKKGGMLLTTHDSTTRYNDVGSVTLTKELRSTFGMDRFHATVDKDYTAGTSYEYQDYKPIKNESDMEYYFSAIAANNFIFDAQTAKFKQFGPIKTSNKDLLIKIIINEKDAKGNNVLIEEVGNEVPEGKNIKITFKLYKTVKDCEEDNNQLSSDSISHIGLFEAGDAVLKYPGQNGTGKDIVINSIKSKKPVPKEVEDPVYELPTATTGKKTVNGDLLYQKFKTTGEQYFLTSQSVFDPGKLDYAPIGQRVFWEEKLKESYPNMGVIAPVGVTDSTAVHESFYKATPYLYAEASVHTSMAWNNSVWDDFEFYETNKLIGGTNRASRNNTGIVTTYPFTLKDELRIAKTHAQTFALDMEDPGMAVWYSLAGCSGTLAKKRSSMFAASPRDGMDSYFLYTYAPRDESGRNTGGTVNYCGAGHSCVTGVARDNNDERRLYINLIVNAVRNKSSSPTITVHEKGKEPEGEVTFNDVPLVPGNKDTNPMLDKEGNYFYTVESENEIPEFNYKVVYSPKVEIKDIKVFYDLDYGKPIMGMTETSTKPEVIGFNQSNVYPNIKDDKDHVLIYRYTKASKAGDMDANRISNTSASSIVGRLRPELYVDSSNNDLLQLKPEYFEPYGNYTYLVIWAKDENDKISYQRIKIKLKEHLFDLTDAEFDNFDIIDYSYNVDKTDRKRFSI